MQFPSTVYETHMNEEINRMTLFTSLLIKREHQYSVGREPRKEVLKSNGM